MAEFRNNLRFIVRISMADAIYTLALSALTGYDKKQKKNKAERKTWEKKIACLSLMTV
jgi:hypothetical protein